MLQYLAVFTVPKLPNFLTTIFDFFEKLDDAFNSLLQPMCDAIGCLVVTIVTPFIATWNFLVFVFLWIISPLNFVIAYFVVSIGEHSKA